MAKNCEKVFDEPGDAHFRALKAGTTHDFLLFWVLCEQLQGEDRDRHTAITKILAVGHCVWSLCFKLVTSCTFEAHLPNEACLSLLARVCTHIGLRWTCTHAQTP